MVSYLEQLETPVPVVDLDRMALNLDRMAAYASLHGLALRPHVKSHKSPRVAAEQLRLGAVGLTCATLAEAEVMSGMCDDLLIAYPPVGSARLERLARLPDSVQVTVAADNLDSLHALGVAAKLGRREIRVLVEVDVGMHRTGLSSPERVVAMARQLAGMGNLSFAGLLLYPGHIRQHADDQGASLSALGADITRFRDALGTVGLTPGVVSGGSTPAAWHMHEVEGITEVRPGTYAYNDRTTAALGACHWDDCAYSILATVISTSVKGQAVIDAGTKSLGREPMPAAASEQHGYGAVLDRPDVTVARMSEEHGMLDLTKTDWRPRLGDLVRIVPNHVCISVAQFDEMIGVRGHAVESRWPVSARGRLAPRDTAPSAPGRPRAV